MGIFGWDLPPGCSVSDIPGNRPEDIEWEGIVENFWDKKRIKKHHGIIVSTQSKRAMGYLFRKRYPKWPSQRDSRLQTAIEEYIEMAIEYGREIGGQEERNYESARKVEDRYYHEDTRNPYLRQFFKKLRQRNQELETALLNTYAGICQIYKDLGGK